MIVSLAPALKFGIRVDRQRQKASVNAHVTMQPPQHLRLRQPVAPILRERCKQRVLRIVVFGKSARGAKNLHGGWIQFSVLSSQEMGRNDNSDDSQNLQFSNFPAPQ